jgi:sulfatase maturation enzyme AslB (radical SAM superfamily)
MIVSLNPTYLCNFRCNFCYLTDEQLGDKHKIDLGVLDRLLNELADNTSIDHVDLYGGEVGLLPAPYFYEMKAIIRKYYAKPINIVTNLARIAPFFLDDDITLSVSWDYDCRERSDDVFRNMYSIDKELHVLLLASQCLIKKDVQELITILSFLRNIKTVEIKPYSTNQANQQPVTHREYEQFVKQWLTCTLPKAFTFINKEKIEASLNKSYNAFSDDHIYITPQGRFAVLEFDLNDNEFFLELDTFDDYIRWTQHEKRRVHMNGYCKTCPYLGHCLSEHLREVKTLVNSCNGFRHLLNWYKNERMEDTTTNNQ